MANQATETAIGPMVMVAVEQDFPQGQRLITDDVAYRLLPLAMKALVALTRFQPARALLIGLSERDSPGV
jgi:O-methyltransferase involved in polyketide biosynthesis